MVIFLPRAIGRFGWYTQSLWRVACVIYTLYDLRVWSTYYDLPTYGYLPSLRELGRSVPISCHAEVKGELAWVFFSEWDPKMAKN